MISPQDIDEVKKILQKRFHFEGKSLSPDMPVLEEMALLFTEKMGWANLTNINSRNIFSFLYSCAAQCLPNSIVLDISAGQCRYKPFFNHAQYIAIDSAVGNPRWDYSHLDLLGDALKLPVRDSSIDICLNFVSLEHYPEPHKAFCEIFRVLKPGGKLFLYAPLTHIEHQEPHDYFRFTRYGLSYLCKQAGLTDEYVLPTNEIHGTVLNLLDTVIKMIKEDEIRIPLQNIVAEIFRPVFNQIVTVNEDALYSPKLPQLPVSYCLSAKRPGTSDSSVLYTSREELVHGIAACPVCHNDLEWTASSVSCQKCGVSFVIDKNTPDFLVHPEAC